jgi:hypothetical protein
MNNLVEACIAENAKNMQNRSTLPRDFSATARAKKSRLVPNLVLRHVLSGNNSISSRARTPRDNTVVLE